ncbi:hypothetical protein [Staphylococcus chromogenes]|uniref:hypothetical protein n=1 Tax=Staphylococcus chromogenes TaxID=46126 RepID=UPI00188EAB55|nr:hypothetical protein [Staphylococcus chromogenes]HDF3152070.1 hypothetical protein [Staphylococcus aureus]
MSLFKKFKDWINKLSIKTTIVLTGIGITLFLAMQQAFVGSLATGGGSDIYAMALSLWITVLIITLILIFMALFIIFFISRVAKVKKNKKKQ